ncbi:MAG: biotin-dependent carboxyltransferase family protein [Bacillota bacterium]|nr:biotin-dependent carboxyltransferase family protein [Bacillota bacterium]
MLKVVKGGFQSLVEDWPGRVGFLGKGMAPSGAMDNVSLEFANLLVGNDVGDAGIEIAVGQFRVMFEEDTVIAVGGSDMKPVLNGNAIPMWEAVKVSKGDLLKFGLYGKEGFRSYLAVAGGIDVPLYLGSRSTCLFGSYGGFEGRQLKDGDELKIGKPAKALHELEGRKLKKEFIPDFVNEFEVRSIAGMNAYPDFATKEGMEYLFSTPFKVSEKSNRSACRLDPLPDYFFSRESGGVGGSHPSNIVDHAYNMRGALNITGNTPVILIADGPTLGGYMCALNIINADLWKIGQCAPGRDHVKFKQVSVEDAIEARLAQRKLFTEDAIK